MKDITKDHRDFILLSNCIPQIIEEIRYYSAYNFIGERIHGYEAPVALLTKDAARALRFASEELFVKGYCFKIFDAYRPVAAVRHFMLWGLEDTDIRMKYCFYPDLDKEELFSKGYIAKMSSHSRGSTVDLTLFDMASGKEVDMGSPFDFFGEISHPDYRGITDEQFENRMLLQNTMVRAGFKPLDNEWWHFTLEGEPYPDTYFQFPVTII